MIVELIELIGIVYNKIEFVNQLKKALFFDIPKF